jgi:hypothetical protein
MTKGEKTMKQILVSLTTKNNIYKTNVDFADKANLLGVAIALIKEEQGIDLTYQPLVSFAIHQG